MRKMLFALMLAPSILLGSCATTGTGTITQDQINALVAQIQAFTTAACAFQPTAAGVTTLISAFFPVAAPFADIVNTIGAAICNAPVTHSAIKRKAVVNTRIVKTPKGPVSITGVPTK